MSALQEFKDFAIKGNAVDMAVGIIVGAGFGKIVSSLVADIFMPPLGLLIGDVDFSKLAITLKEATPTTPAVTLNYGQFIQTVVDFTIVAFSIFIVVRLLHSLRKTEEAKQAPPPPPSKEEVLLTEIRDLLKNQPQNTSKEETFH